MKLYDMDGLRSYYASHYGDMYLLRHVSPDAYPQWRKYLWWSWIPHGAIEIIATAERA